MVLSGLNIIKTDPGQKQRQQLMFPKNILRYPPREHASKFSREGPQQPVLKENCL